MIVSVLVVLVSVVLFLVKARIGALRTLFVSNIGASSLRPVEIQRFMRAGAPIRRKSPSNAPT